MNEEQVEKIVEREFERLVVDKFGRTVEQIKEYLLNQIN